MMTLLPADSPAPVAPPTELRGLHARLETWLCDSAFPLWAATGVDPRSGGFFEAIGQDGLPQHLPRRARVAPRQVFAFALAAELGWRGDAAAIVRRGIDDYAVHYQRNDGLYMASTDSAGTALDRRADLYDQAFVLLGFAAAAQVLHARPEFEHKALLLRAAIDRRLRAPDQGFYSTDQAPLYRESNPHMHLLEACGIWAEVGVDPAWAAWSSELADLGTRSFMRGHCGAVGEYFTNTWAPGSGERSRVEPGHQFEWAWLLLRAARDPDAAHAQAALGLIALGETHGIQNGVAVNALRGDLALLDGSARLWPQTERLKAAVAAVVRTGEVRYWSMALAATQSLLPYLETRIAGLWFDRRMGDGRFIDEPAPASSFYHLVGAIAALGAALKTAPL